MLGGRFRKATGSKINWKRSNIFWFIAGLAAVIYGIFAFVKREFVTYLFLKSEFVLMDYAEPKILFYIDYLAIMGLCIFVARYLSYRAGGKFLEWPRWR